MSRHRVQARAASRGGAGQRRAKSLAASPIAIGSAASGAAKKEEVEESAILEVLAATPGEGATSMRLVVSRPKQDEECGIGMELIAEYRMEWLPPSVKQCVIPDKPELTKATIPGCGHGFNALALLYHFVKNEMTCPFCRGGFSKKRMSRLSVPVHLREAMAEHLRSMRGEEQQEQDAMDTLSVLTLLEHEVNLEDFMRTNRQVLILYAYVGADSTEPLLVQEVQLESSVSSGGTLRFSSFTHSMRELNRNLRLLPATMTCFEAVVATRAMFGGALALVKSQRFSLAAGGGVTVVQCMTSTDGAEVRLEAHSDPVTQGLGMVVLTMPSHLVHALVVHNTSNQVYHPILLDPDSGLVAEMARG